MKYKSKDPSIEAKSNYEMEHDTDEPTITIKRAAERAGVTTVQIGRLIKRGVLAIPDYATTWRQKPILLVSYEHWLANRKPAGQPKKKYLMHNGELVRRIEPDEVIT